VRAITELGYMDMVGVFLELDDEQLEDVKTNKNYYQNISLMKDYTQSKGDNAHFVGMFNNNGAILIHKNLDLLFKDYKSVSWWDKEEESFKIIRR